MDRIETFYIHALARLAHEASSRGKHPLRQDQYINFFQLFMRDRRLGSSQALDFFDRCFTLEVNWQKLRGVKKKWK